MLEFVRWIDDDAIAHDHLRMRITNLTQPNLTSPKLTLSQGILVYEFHNYIMAGRKFMKFCMDIMPLCYKCKLTVFNILHTLIPAREMFEVVR
jgi:hypothetical protein